jgi:hypothetical protein
MTGRRLVCWLIGHTGERVPGRWTQSQTMVWRCRRCGQTWST